MNRAKYFLVIFAAVASGFVSSLITVHFFASYKAVAQDIDKKNAQKSESRNPNKMNVIEANEFRLVDLEGKCLAKLTMEEDKSMAALVDAAYNPKKSKTYLAVLEMGTASGKIRITGDNVEISDIITKTSLQAGSLAIGNRSRIYIHADSAGTAIQLWDDKSINRAVLGSVDLSVIDTGEIQKRPESSLVLFGRDGKVVYSAPPGR